MRKNKTNKDALWKILMVLVTIVGVTLRLVGNDWDQGHHLHPDERMLLIVAQRIEFFSSMNPDFFNYGSLPIYVLAGAAQLLDPFVDGVVDSYDSMLYLGRMISTLLDVATMIVVGWIAKVLFDDKRIVLCAMVFYGLMFFPIQNSNFFIVDTFLHLLVSLLFIQIINYLKVPTVKLVVLMGVCFGALLAVKVTPIVFGPVVVIVLGLRLRKTKVGFVGWRRWIGGIVLFGAVTLAINVLVMPYAYLEWPRFYRDVIAQIEMNSNAYVFPYTLQYVSTLPYFYYLNNMFWWGVGPVICSVFGLGLMALWVGKFDWVKNKKHETKWLVLSYFAMNVFYFLVIGRSAVKFMRYMLPLYPFIAVIAGYGMVWVWQGMKDKVMKYGAGVLIFGLAYVWTAGFLSLYSQKHTRVRASEWMAENIPVNSVLAVEHWDDRLPLFGSTSFEYEELELYNLPDDERKWQKLDGQLNRADYVVLASNRLYVPLQRLSDCRVYKKCYPRTEEYYRKLLGEELGFYKMAEFTSYPQMPWGEMSDDDADESFTVYDHPKVMVFGRKKLPKNRDADN